MSKRKKREKAAPTTTVTRVPANLDPVRISAGSFRATVLGITAKTAPREPDEALAKRVARDVAKLMARFDGKGQAELPQPEPDLSAYEDALVVALRTCPHKNVSSTIIARGEYQCQDCGKYLSSEDMRKLRASDPWWYLR